MRLLKNTSSSFRRVQATAGAVLLAWVGVQLMGCQKGLEMKEFVATTPYKATNAVRIGFSDAEYIQDPLYITNTVNIPYRVYINNVPLVRPLMPYSTVVGDNAATVNTDNNYYYTVPVPDSLLASGQVKIRVERLGYTNTIEVLVPLKSNSQVVANVEAGNSLRLTVEDLGDSTAPGLGQSMVRLDNRTGFKARLVATIPAFKRDTVLVSGVDDGSVSRFVAVESGLYDNLRIQYDDPALSAKYLVRPVYLREGYTYTVKGHLFANPITPANNVITTGIGEQAYYPRSLETALISIVHAHPTLRTLTVDLGNGFLQPAIAPGEALYNQRIPIGNFTATAYEAATGTRFSGLPGVLHRLDNSTGYLIQASSTDASLRLMQVTNLSRDTAGYGIRYINLSPDAGPVTFSNFVGGQDYIPDTLRMAGRPYAQPNTLQPAFDPNGNLIQVNTDPFVYTTSPPTALRALQGGGLKTAPGDVLTAAVNNPFASGPGIYTVVLTGLYANRSLRINVYRHSH